MNHFELNLDWQAIDIQLCLPITLALVFFVIYWFTAHSTSIKKYFYNKYDYDTASLKHIFFTKITGFISMGIVPTIICLIFIPEITLAEYGLTFISETTLFSITWTLGLCALVIPLAYISAKKPKNLVNYPQIRAKNGQKKR